MRIVNPIALNSIFICLTACTTSAIYAPVVDATIETPPKSGIYHVHNDDTLYSIAWRFGLDYRELARINHISSPYSIKPKQIIYLRSTFIKHKTAIKNIPNKIIEQEPNKKISYWHRPSKGKIICKYSEINKGLNFAGVLGDAIYATAPGKVVYSGNGLRGYGNLIIIKHNSIYLSAYAHNNKVFVKQGDWVMGGQKIAEMGNTGTKQIMLHFEIRKQGKPINPLTRM